MELKDYNSNTWYYVKLQLTNWYVRGNLFDCEIENAIHIRVNGSGLLDTNTYVVKNTKEKLVSNKHEIYYIRPATEREIEKITETYNLK